jgi:hypothetical protein
MPARIPIPPPYAGELIIPAGDDAVRLEPLQVSLKEAARLLAYDLRTIQRLISRGEAGEYLASYRKGERIAIAGRLQSSEYIDRESVKRSSVEVVVLRSEPAPLPRRAEAAAAEPEPASDEPAAEPEVIAEAEAEPLAEPAAELPAKPRRRRKAA